MSLIKSGAFVVLLALASRASTLSVVAEDPYVTKMYPCMGTYGDFVLCGGGGPPVSDACEIAFVGQPACTGNCDNKSGFMCHTDDECDGQTGNPDAQCQTANYPGTTYKWIFECPLIADDDGCACFIDYDILTTRDLTWKEFTWSSSTCD